MRAPAGNWRCVRSAGSLAALTSALVVSLAACSTHYARPGIVVTDASGRPHAECPVCKCNADLACVDVVVESGTPKAAYGEKDYYFCSDECREKFRADPGRYTPKKP